MGKEPWNLKLFCVLVAPLELIMWTLGWLLGVRVEKDIEEE